MWALLEKIAPLILAVVGTVILPYLRQSGKYDQTRRWVVVAQGILAQILAAFPKASPTELQTKLVQELVTRNVPEKDAPGVAAAALQAAGHKPLEK